MAGMYVNGVQQIMAGNVDLINDSISALLINTDLYAVDLDTDANQSDIPTDAVLAEKTLTGNTLDGTTFRADDATLNAVEGVQVGAVILIKDTGEYTNSTLLAYLDDAAQFPITPDGEDITVRWALDVNGIFKL